jgi:hypothetical protein
VQHRSRFARRLCVAVDAKSYGALDNVAQYDTQTLLPCVLDDAAIAAGLDRSRWLKQPQGDGELALVPPDQPEPLLVDDFVRELDATLQLRNYGRIPEARLRLRVAIDFGVAYEAPSGFAGEAVVATARLLASDGLHRALAEADDADVAVVLSARVFQTVLNRHTSLTADQFNRIEVSEKEYTSEAWIRVLRHGAPPSGEASGKLSQAPPGKGSSRSTRSASVVRNNVRNHFYGPVDAGVIGINIAAEPSDQT